MSNSKQKVRKDLTLIQQPAAHGQHLHEGPKLLMLGEKLSQVLTAKKPRIASIEKGNQGEQRATSGSRIINKHQENKSLAALYLSWSGLPLIWGEAVLAGEKPWL